MAHHIPSAGVTAPAQPCQFGSRGRLAPAGYCLALLLALTARTPAQAQAQATPGDSATEAADATRRLVPVIVSGTRDSYASDGPVTSAAALPLTAQEIPQSVSIITRQRLDDQSLRSVADVLEQATGISVRTLDSERASFSARGFGIGSLQTDGVIMPLDGQWGYGEVALDTVLYERVDIVRGATGLMTGAGEPSASVNLIRKMPLAGFAVQAALHAGNQHRRGGHVDLNLPITEDGSVRSRFVAAYDDSESHRDFYRHRKATLYGVVQADLTPSTTATLGLDYQDSRPRGVSVGGYPLFYQDDGRTPDRRSATNGAPWSTWENKGVNVFANLAHRFGNGWEVRGAYAYSSYDLDSRTLWLTGYPDRATGLGVVAAPNTRHYQGSRHLRTWSLQAQGPFSLFGRQHEAAVGWTQSRHQQRIDAGDAPSPLAPIGDFFAWDGSYPEPDWNPVTTVDDGITRQRGLYAVTRWSLADPLTLIAGARLSSWQTERDYWGFDRSYENRNVVTPYLGLLYAFHPQYTAYASYTDIFNPQNYRDAEGNLLDPVEGRTYEIGVKAQWFDKRLDGALAVFDTLQDNVGQRDPSGRVQPDGTPAYIASRGVRSRGFELELNGRISQSWNIFAGFSHYTASNADGDRHAPYAPRTQFKLFTAYRLPGTLHAWTVGAGLRWQSATYAMATDAQRNARQVDQSSYALVDAMARYQINPQFALSLNVKNLFDKTYYSQMGVYNQALYGPARQVLLTLEGRF